MDLHASVIDQLLITNTKMIHACFLRRINPNSLLPFTLQAHKAVYMIKTRGLKRFISNVMGIEGISLFQYFKHCLKDKNYSIEIRDMDVFWRNEAHYV
jgi:hypothetical protein